MKKRRIESSSPAKPLEPAKPAPAPVGAGEAAVIGEDGPPYIESISSTGPVVFGAAGLLMAVALAFMIFYSRVGVIPVQRLDTLVGEVESDQALRLEEAGEYDAAEAEYKRALDSKFTSAKNRGFALKHLGTLLWWRKGWNEALPYLEAAIKEPDRPITVYEPLCDCLFKAGRHDDAIEQAKAWLAMAQQMKDSAQEGLALWAAGRSLLAKGSADEALKQFEQAQEVNSSAALARSIGLALNDKGMGAQAVPYLDRYLHATSGPKADEIRKIRDKIAPPQK